MAVTATLELHLRAEKLDDAPAVLEATLAQTRAFEGNEGIEVLVDVDDPAHITVIEHWASIERDDAYRAWRATPEGAARLGELLAGAPTLTRYDTQAAY